MTIVSTGSLTLKDMNDAKQLGMSIGGSQSKTVIYDGVSAYSPNYSTAGSNQILTPTLRIAGGGIVTPSATRWFYRTNGSGAETAITASGSGYTLGATQPITLTISSNVVASNTTMTYIAEADYTDPDTTFLITTRAEIEIVKVTNGAVGENAVTSFLSNSNASVPANSSGTVSSYSNVATDVYVYDGATPLVHDGVGTTAGKFKVTAVGANITAGAVTASASGTARAVIAVATTPNMTQDSATITVTVTGKQLDGTAINAIVLTQTINKQKSGVDSTVYSVKPSASVISKSALGVTSPATLTFTGYTTVGGGTPSSVASGYKFIIGTQTAVGGTYTDGAATAALASTTFTTSFTNLVSVRARLYRASDTPNGAVNMVDEQTVYVVQDGTNSIYANIWAPDGNAIQNSVGQLTARADIYDGVTLANASAYKWYIQNPLATTSSLGDADGGAGWELLTSVPDPTATGTTSAPVTAGATLPVATYYIKYTWVSKVGESKGSSTQQTQATTAVGQGLSFTAPAFPTGVTSAKVYVGNATGDANLYYQGDINVSAGAFVVKALNTSTGKVPTTTGGAVTTNATLYIQAWGILGMEGFKCVATYNSIKYSGVVTVQDLSDPIQVDIQGVEVFKNGTGTTALKAVLWQNGAELDASGTIYTYTWKLYDSANVLQTTTYSTMTGKNVTIDARDINARANIICEVSK
jgi:hypothetical protein